MIKIDPNINTNSDNYQNIIKNQPPYFNNKTESDLRLTENSPAINSGDNSTEGSIDIEGNTRINPDIGAYEFIE